MPHKIFLGPAGVPATSEKRDTISGVKRVHALGLSAMEVEFVRGVRMSGALAAEVGETASALGVELSVHAPYFINLSSDRAPVIEASKKRILETAERASIMGAKTIVIHAGYYGSLSSEQCYEKIKNELEVLSDDARKNNWNVLLGIETMGKMSQFAGLDDIVKICKEVKGCVPYVDWAHIFVRNNGNIDYAQILEKLGAKHIRSHFSNVKKNAKGNYVDIHAPIDHAPAFEPLATAIMKEKRDITIISESPILEQDSLRMKRVFEKLGYKF